MPDGIVLWFVLGAAAAVVFFGVALWVSITGVSDVRDLLHRQRPDDDAR